MKSISSWKGPSALSPRVNPTVLTWKIEKVTRSTNPVALNDVTRLYSTLSSQSECWLSCTLPQLVRKNLENGICKTGRRVEGRRLVRVGFSQVCWANLDVLPVGPASGVQEITIDVVFLVSEVGFRSNIDHPWAAIATHAQMQCVEWGPVVVLYSIKKTLRDKGLVFNFGT